MSTSEGISQNPIDLSNSQPTSPIDNSQPLSPVENPSPPLSNQNVDDVQDGDTWSLRKRKTTSTVWLHFKKEKLKGEWKAICNYCGDKLGAGLKNGTNHLHSHYKRKHMIVQGMRQQVLTNNFNKGHAKITSYSLIKKQLEVNSQMP